MKYIISTIAFLIPSLVLGHEGHQQASMGMGLASGLLHPLLGLDHLLSLIAVAFFASRLSGKQKYLVPLSFIGLMMVGFFSAHAGIHFIAASTIESLISISLVTAAVIVFAGHWMQNHAAFNTIAAWAFTGFAAFHGMAHGIEIPVGADALMFASGFSIACGIAISISYLLISALSQRLNAPQNAS